MNAILKKFLMFSFVFTFAVAFTATAFAAVSPLVTMGVPRFGGWSNFSVEKEKKANKNADGGIYLNTSPYTFNIYGQLYKESAKDKKNEKALNGNITLSVKKWKRKPYYASQKGTGKYKSAITSYTLEPDYRYITYKFEP